MGACEAFSPAWGRDMSIRKILVALAISTCLPAQVHAQDWPRQPVKIIVSAAAGGPIDVFGRVMAERMGQILGQNVVVENVPGAGGMVGGQRVARADPDGSTVLLGTIATHTHSQNLYKQPLYNSVTDFMPVALIAEIPLVLIVRNDLPADNLEQFVAYAKANSEKMNYGSAGVGSATHLGCALLTSAIGAKIQHVPYRGTAPAMQDLQNGRIDFLCEIVLTAAPQIEGDRKGHRHTVVDTLRRAARRADRAGARLCEHGGRYLDGLFPAQGNAPAHRRQAACGHPANHRDASGEGSAGEAWRDPCCARAALARLSCRIRESGRREMGGCGEGERHRAAIMTQKLIFSPSAYF